MPDILDDMVAFGRMVREGVKGKMEALDTWGSVYGLKRGDLTFDEGGWIHLTERGKKRSELCPYEDQEFPHITVVTAWFDANRFPSTR